MIKRIMVCISLMLAIPSVMATTGTINNASFTTCFSSIADCAQIRVNAIKRAKNTINIQWYGLMSEPMMQALNKAKRRGVSVMVLLNMSNTVARYAAMQRLKANKIPFMVYQKSGDAVGKLTVIDGKTVVIGDALMIKSSVLSKPYINNFNAVKSTSETESQYCSDTNQCRPLLGGNKTIIFNNPRQQGVGTELRLLETRKRNLN